MWSDAYLTLTGAHRIERRGEGVCYKGNQDGDFVKWINNMSAPTMLPPYYGGAARSRLIAILADGHEGVCLSQEQMDKIACWIDLVVPYCGDYMEANAWSQKEMRMYRHFLNKRTRMEEIEQRNIEELLAAQSSVDDI